MNIPKINFAQNIQKLSQQKAVPRITQLACDTVSFSGAKALEAGTDAMVETLRKIGDFLAQGKYKLVSDATSLIQAGKIKEAIEFLNKNAPLEGAIKVIDDGIEVLGKDWDGSPVTKIFKNVPGFKNLGLQETFTPEVRAKLLKEAFGIEPKTTVGMVGWTNVKPQNVAGGTSLTKGELTQKYIEATEEFYEPVDRYLGSIGMQPTDRALVSSVSYDGVDKAIMDIGEKNGINTLTITPFTYAQYGRELHPHPTVITDTISQYVDGYGQLTDAIVVTGGRDHAFKFDAGGKWTKQSNGLIIPVDVLKDFKGIEVPATINGKIENAAACAYETFSDPLPRGLVDKFKTLPSDSTKQDLQHPAQQALAAAMADKLIENGLKL